MKKEYIITVTLKDGTIIKSQRDYNWGFEDELNDTRKQFANINGNMFNKDNIVSVVTEENPNYKKEQEEDNEESVL